ncbi:MAG: hypothetical protein IPI93_14335 [Sphingobacteriaceae bacterium]|nr:hypothetical protein [Sphingobacteriaceae bacterium]
MKKTKKKQGKPLKIELDAQFQETLEELKVDEKKLRDEHKIFIKTIVDLCVNAKNGIIVSNPDSKDESTTKHNYSKKSLKKADDFLKKYAIKCKV